MRDVLFPENEIKRCSKERTELRFRKNEIPLLGRKVRNHLGPPGPFHTVRWKEPEFSVIPAMGIAHIDDEVFLLPPFFKEFSNGGDDLLHLMPHKEHPIRMHEVVEHIDDQKGSGHPSPPFTPVSLSATL